MDETQDAEAHARCVRGEYLRRTEDLPERASLQTQHSRTAMPAGAVVMRKVRADRAR